MDDEIYMLRYALSEKERLIDSLRLEIRDLKFEILEMKKRNNTDGFGEIYD